MKAINIRTGGMLSALLLIVFTAAIAARPVSANHSWNNYHWARQSNPFTLKLNGSLSTAWKPYLVTASDDWSKSIVLDTVISQGSNNPKTCKPVSGQVEVCNAAYGKNGWLGLAQVWIDTSSHITQGVVKMNDSYMSLAPYNTVAQKNHVMCQEVGHIFGLGHQDESGADLGTCMDYSNSLASQHPNSHDYTQLEQIYAHLDSKTTVGSFILSGTNASNADFNDSRNWGRRVFRSSNGHNEIFEQTLQNGSKLVTFVNLAEHH